MRNTTIAALSKTLPLRVSSLVPCISNFLLHVARCIGLLLLIIIILVVWFFVWVINSHVERKRKERENYEWFEREVAFLLKALLKDRDLVSKYGEKIDDEARSGWFTEGLGPLKTAQLQKSVEDWLNETETMINQGVGELVHKNGSRRKISSDDRGNLEKHLKKGSEDDIYGALAKLRSKIRSLKGGPVDDEQEHLKPDHKACITEIDDNVKRLYEQLSAPDIGESVRKVRLHLLLLRTFLGDLEKFTLESETEMAWVEEAKKLVDKVSSALDHLEKKKHWSSIWSGSTRESTKRELEAVDKGFSNLFEIKEVHRLKFIKEVPVQASQKETSSDANLLEKLKDAIKSSTEERLDQVNKLIDEAEGNSAKKFKMADKADLEERGLLKRSIEAYTIDVKPVTSPIVALEEDTNAVLELLTLANNEASVVVSIVGMRGIGKTTLAKKVFEHIKAGFEHFWVPIPNPVDNHCLHQLLAEKVFDRLDQQQKPYLVVLDNIAKKGWEALIDAFPKRDGSRILLTTRDEIGAGDRGQVTKTYGLRLRTKEESWRLFKARVPPHSDVEKLAKETVGKCWGLPVEIVDFAYLMAGMDVSDPRLAERLKDIELNPSSQPANSRLTKRNRNQSPWSEHFELTKDKWNKEEPSEKFLGLFLLFPEDYEIPARRLLGFWNAIESGDNKKKPEDYLKELINRNMIQVVDRNHDGKVKKYCMPNFLQRRREGELELEEDSSSHKDLIFLGSEPGEEIFAELRRGIRGKKFQNLRVLDLEHVFKPQLPHSIGKLKELRYLGLRWTYLESIPSSIGDLTNLQTLDIKHTCIREVPGSIWGLKNLRHLYLNHNYRSKIGHRQSPNFLENLQTLWGVFIDEESFPKNKLKKLTNLTKLGVAFQLPPVKQNKLADCVVKFTNLESLKLSSIGETGKPQDLLWKKPANLNKLSSLYLCGRLTGQNIKDNFPENLRDLTLSASGLTADPMQTLGQLGNLKSLCFYSDSYNGREMVIHKGGFRQLLVLRLWKLKFLEELQVEEGAMERLRELDIRSCDKLQVKNIALKHLKSLEELKLPNMEENLK